MKSPQRMRYEAEVEVIRRKLGDLEAMREKLGLSQRKICQLLLVDPSAWTRWIKGEDGEESAPPHIYRMLQWYLALQDKYPALDANFWLATVSRTKDPALDESRDLRLTKLQTEMASLGSELERFRTLEFDESRSRHSVTAELDKKVSRVEKEIEAAETRFKKQIWYVIAAVWAAGLALGLLL